MLSKQYYPAPQIRYCWVEDRVIILDLHSESYFALDPTASVMWQQLTRLQDRDSRPRDLRNFCAAASTESVDLEADWESFIQRCLTAGFLTETQAPSPPETEASTGRIPGRRFLTLRAWWSLWRVTRALAKRGFAPTYNAALGLPKLPEMQTRQETESLATALKAFGRSENFLYLKKAPRDCLPRSLALFFFLRAIGWPVEHVIGLQQFPFLAHAWTEYHGEVLHDDPRNQERFTVIARITA